MTTKPASIGALSFSARRVAGTLGNAQPNMRMSMRNSIPRLSISVNTCVASIQLYR